MHGTRSTTITPARSTAATLSGLLDSRRMDGEPEVAQHFAGQLVAAQVGLEAERLVGFHGIGALVLEFVGAQLVQQPDAAPFLVLVDEQAAALLGDALERQFQLRAAVAAQAVEDVSGEALGMDAHQGRAAPGCRWRGQSGPPS